MPNYYHFGDASVSLSGSVLGLVQNAIVKETADKYTLIDHQVGSPVGTVFDSSLYNVSLSLYDIGQLLMFSIPEINASYEYVPLTGMNFQLENFSEGKTLSFTSTMFYQSINISASVDGLSTADIGLIGYSATLTATALASPSAPSYLPFRGKNIDIRVLDSGSSSMLYHPQSVSLSISIPTQPIKGIDASVYSSMFVGIPDISGSFECLDHDETLVDGKIINIWLQYRDSNDALVRGIAVYNAIITNVERSYLVNTNDFIGNCKIDWSLHPNTFSNTYGSVLFY